MDNKSTHVIPESTYKLFENLSKTIEDGKKDIIQSLIVHIFEIIKQKSKVGRSDGSLYLIDYDYENYSDADFYTIVKEIQEQLFKFDIKIKGGWSNTCRSLYIDIEWNKRWKKYWFFGIRQYYG
jgi:hypothetical protein